MLLELQRRFRAGLLASDPAPLALVDAPERFDIHRRNVFISLITVLEAAFPVTERLLGRGAFRALARDFIAAAPPDRPQLLAYGRDFPGVIADPAIADVARLEWARQEAFFAADAAPLAPAALAGLDADRIATLRLTPLPSLRLVASRYPIQSLWSGAAPDDAAESVLVLRRSGQVEAWVIDAGSFALLSVLAAGQSLLEAAAAALAAEPGFDLQAALAAELVRGSFAAMAP